MTSIPSTPNQEWDRSSSVEMKFGLQKKSGIFSAVLIYPHPTQSSSCHLKAVTELVNALIQTRTFPGETSSEIPSQVVKVKIEGDQLLMLDKSNTLSKYNLSNLTAYPELAKPIRTILNTNSIAKSQFSPGIAKPIPSSMTTAAPVFTKPATAPMGDSNEPEAICREYGVHGLINSTGHACFANTSMQLLSNIPSLKASVMDKLEGGLQPLQHYGALKDGKELISIWNATRPPKEQFNLGRDEMGSEFFDRIVDSVRDYPMINTQVETTKHDGSITRKEEPRTFLTLIADHKKKPTIDFEDALKRDFLPTTGDVSTKTYLREAPKQLLLRVNRVSLDGAKDNRPLTNIPLILDLDSYDVMEKGKRANPLELKGFFVQTGSASSGHYTAYFQKPHPQDPSKHQWFCANDSIVRPISLNEALKAASQASDLYYDNVVVSGYQLTERSSLIEQHIVSIPTIPKENLLTIYTQMFTPTEQRNIAKTIAKEVKSKSQFWEWFLNLFKSDITIGKDYITRHTESSLFREQITAALKEKQSTLDRGIFS